MSLQIFCGLPPLFSRIPDAAMPYCAAPPPAERASKRSAVRLGVYVAAWYKSHSLRSDPDRENFEPIRYLDFRKEKSVIFRRPRRSSLLPPPCRASRSSPTQAEIDVIGGGYAGERPLAARPTCRPVAHENPPTPTWARTTGAAARRGRRRATAGNGGAGGRGTSAHYVRLMCF